MFGLFTKPQPTQTSHQRRDKALSLSETRLSTAEAMVQRALTFKQDTVTNCMKEEEVDLADLAEKTKVAQERLLQLQTMISGEIVIPETPVVE